ncbi:MAG: beta-ketoacyl-ACP synthase III [Planctomycetota bacterium]
MSQPLRAAIRGTGYAVPDTIMTNEDFEKIIDTSDEWITKRTGIKERRICSEGESTRTLAVQAARNAIADAGIEADQLDLIICATITPDLPFPATACLVQNELGLSGVPAFDVSGACSGFVYGLTIGSKFIETGMHKRVMVIGVDVMSRFTDYSDRGSCILFGDGAGAVILEATEEDRGVVFTTMHAEGSGWDFIHVPAGGTAKPPSAETVAAGEHYVRMRGRDVYKFAVEKMQWLLGECMDQAGLTVDDVDLVVPHQVNVRIIKSATEKFDFPMDKIYLNIERYGNTSGASVPMALAEAREKGLVKSGDNLLLVAFGAGLTWAGAVVKM